jgi:hypothetical protein
MAPMYAGMRTWWLVALIGGIVWTEQLRLDGVRLLRPAAVLLAAAAVLTELG